LCGFSFGSSEVDGRRNFCKQAWLLKKEPNQ
jgi:hypothetical protein